MTTDEKQPTNIFAKITAKARDIANKVKQTNETLSPDLEQAIIKYIKLERKKGVKERTIRRAVLRKYKLILK